MRHGCAKPTHGVLTVHTELTSHSDARTGGRRRDRDETHARERLSRTRSRDRCRERRGRVNRAIHWIDLV